MANGTRTKLRTKKTRTEAGFQGGPEKQITTIKKEKTTKRGTKTKKVERVNGKKSMKITTKRTGEISPGKTEKSITKKQYGTGKDKFKSKASSKVKTTKSGKGMTFTKKTSDKEPGLKSSTKAKEYSGTKSKGTSTYTKGTRKEKGKKRTRYGSYVGRGVGKRKTK